MPIDPKRLMSMAGAVKPPKKAAPPPAEDEEELDYEEDEEVEVPDVPEDEGEEEVPEEGQGLEGSGTGPANPNVVIPFLSQYASELEACCDELDYDMLIDPEIDMSDEDVAIMQEGALMLPPRLQKNLWHLTGIDIDAAGAIATYLEDEGLITDAERAAGWIYRIGQLLTGESDASAAEEVPEEELEEEEPLEEEEV